MYRISKCWICELPVFKLNCIIACIAGTSFFLGWWILFDLQSSYPELMQKKKIYHLPGIVGTITLLFNNSIPANSLRGSSYYSSSGVCGKGAAILCLFLGLMAGFGALIGACYIWIADFLLSNDEYVWPGYAIFGQNLLIFSANMLMRFARRMDTL